MEKRQRWSIISVLCLGLLVVVVGSLRVYTIWQTYSSNDPTWNSTLHWIYSEVEVDVALVSSVAYIVV